jgi:hypothetical protein
MRRRKNYERSIDGGGESGGSCGGDGGCGRSWLYPAVELEKWKGRKEEGERVEEKRRGKGAMLLVLLFLLPLLLLLKDASVRKRVLQQMKVRLRMRAVCESTEGGWRERKRERKEEEEWRNKKGERELNKKEKI